LTDALDAWAEAESRITVEELEDLFSLPAAREKPAVVK
jgi:hypothetical protein